MSTGVHTAPRRERRSPFDSGHGRGRPIVFSYVPALDGLRAVAVLGVMLYHGGAPVAAGGFLGVDVFFVLSGFLITSLLLGEWTRSLTIRLGQFWARRARRLLPALLVMLVGVALIVKVFSGPGEFAGLRLDSLATLFYVANWHFIVGGGNYFATTAQPSMLQHMWTLAIEEQFYIVWPPVVLAMLHLGRKLRPSRRLWPVLSVAVFGAIASAVDMRLSYLGGASVMRLYEGTDTRSQDILVGAALAIGMAMWAQHRTTLTSSTALDRTPGQRPHPAAGTAGAVPPRPHRRDLHRRRGLGIRPITAWEITPRPVRAVLQAGGWLALLVGVVLCWRVTGPGAALFEGGFFVFALGVALVIFCVVTTQGDSLSRSLGNPAFRYLGKISYGTYLWHVPLFALLTAERLHLGGYPLLLVRIAVTLIVASASFYLVEEPIRSRKTRTFSEWRAWLLTTGAFLGVVVVTVAATVPTAAEAAGPLRVQGTAYVGPPVKVMVFGDSVAWRMAFAMLASQPQDSYDVSIDNGAIIGCGLLRSTQYRLYGVEHPEVPACNSSAPAADQWPAQWEGDLEQFRPNVVVVLAGRWELSDRMIDGRWLHIGQPAFDSVVKQSLEQAVQVGTSTGALMELMTSPCFAPNEQPDGQVWPEDTPARLNAYNAIVRQVAAEHPATVQLNDFESQLCPGGAYQESLDGVQIRDGDGMHIVPTAAAGQWLDVRVLPQLIRVGRLAMAGQSLLPSASPAGTSPTPSLSASGAGP
jgi:peptidoglycan/LPS O-acetylase OafA/YrhL